MKNELPSTSYGVSIGSYLYASGGLVRLRRIELNRIISVSLQLNIGYWSLQRGFVFVAAGAFQQIGNCGVV